MNHVKTTFCRLLTTIVLGFSIETACACMVCIPFPRETFTDQILTAQIVVLAREHPEKDFSYQVETILKGDINHPEIDLFLASRTRRRLAENPEESVVLAYDARTQNWQRAGYATPAYESLVREILIRESSWNPSFGKERRPRFFLPYLANEDPTIRELASLEVGQASYSLIREADRFIPRQQVHNFLAEPKYMEWWALYILLLGVDATPAEAEIIRDAIKNHARFNQSLNLSAWATALIEIDGESGINWLEENYLLNANRPNDHVLDVVKALSVQGAKVDSTLRSRIAKSYSGLVESHPALAGWVARDLTAWSDWRFTDVLRKLREQSVAIDASTAYAIDYYLKRAQLTQD